MAPCCMLGEDWIGLGTATKIQTWIGNGRTEFDAAAGRLLERMIGRRQDPAAQWAEIRGLVNLE